MSVEPPACAGPVIVGVVEYWARRYPHLKPPIFRAEDVMPLLHGDDAAYNAASTLLDAERVHFPEGDEI
ncbi:hypothetical protein SAMN04244553_3612 [Nocardia amikacinitolerans]|uniref:Uncharacterized protein n=1 Tax=Nocardia amikacinitolerans TaxID=756689 RepID=A0A285LH30_9NOCA|nr:hypothetical protein [Nocardia amikacinitolerans]SNY84270.1 hypothetical protein SAMN04244553_3612 [Nocardia amikacinitolerans]